MSLQVKVKSNAKEVSRFLQLMHSKQIPFATSLALNDTAKDVRKHIVKRTFPEAFNLKKKGFPNQVIFTEFSTKKNLTASVGNINTKKKRVRAISMLNLHAEGGIKKPKRSLYLAIPSRELNGKYHNKKIPKSRTPQAIFASTDRRGSKRGFVQRFKGGKAIFQRKTLKAYPISLFYFLKPIAKINKTLKFYEDANRVAKKVYDKHFDKAFQKAIRTAK